MKEAQEELYGNPGTQYSLGRKAREAVEKARAQVAAAINARPENIIFTSGGSESNNTVVAGLYDWLRTSDKDTFFYSEIEHESLLYAISAMKIKHGFYARKIGVNGTGNVDFDKFKTLFRMNRAGIVSVMYMNNEIGTVQRHMKEMVEFTHQNGALFHTDCVQAFGSVPIDVQEIGCDFMSLSSHKIHGPKGVGALYCSDAGFAALRPLINGGEHQEFGLRGGTENVPGIVGFGEACRELKPEVYDYVSMLSSRFIKTLYQEAELRKLTDHFQLNNAFQNPSGKIISLTIHGIDNDLMQAVLDKRGVCVGTGSACNSKSVQPSHVLKAIGLSDRDAMSTIRISFSRGNSLEEVKEAAREIVKATEELLRVSAAIIGGEEA